MTIQYIITGDEYSQMRGEILRVRELLCIFQTQQEKTLFPSPAWKQIQTQIQDFTKYAEGLEFCLQIIGLPY